MGSSEGDSPTTNFIKNLGILFGIIVSIIVIYQFVKGDKTLQESLRKLSSQPGVHLDEFDYSLYDGNYDPNFWMLLHNEETKIFQKDGVLTISQEHNSPGGAGLIPISYNQFTLTTPIFIEAKLMINQRQDGHGFIFIGGGQEYSDCVFGRYSDNKAQLSCNYIVPSGIRTGFNSIKVLVDYGTWHTLRLEVRPKTMEYRYFADGKEIGKYIPPNAEELKSSFYGMQIGSGNDSSSSITYSAYFDYVKIGPVNP